MTISPREREITALLCEESLSNKQIAARTGLTEGSVKIYFSRLNKKLKLHSRVELVIWYWRGLVDAQAKRINAA